jgi:predicted PurR-regulated permease PerM
MPISSASILKKLLLLFLVVAGLIFAKDFLIPLSLGAVLATLLLPLARKMESKGMPKALSSTLCLMVVLFGIALVFLMISWQISEIVKDITLIREEFAAKTILVQEYIFNQFGLTADAQWQMIKNRESSIANFIQNFAGSVFSVSGTVLFILVYIFLFLYYRTHLKNFILKLFPANQQIATEQIIQRCAKVSQQYLVGLAKMIGCLWAMYGLGFWLLGVENALFFAVLCGMLEIIPFIGNLTGTGITVLVAAVNGGSMAMLGGIVIVYGSVQLIQGWVLEPLILGPQVKINPFFTILALVLGEIIWGIPGIILAIPLTAITKIICDHIDSLKPYGFLIGELESSSAEFSRKRWWQRKK